MKTQNQLLQTLFPINNKDSGYSEPELLKAENRLKITLPKDLRTLYLTRAKNSILNSCHYFEKPEDLTIHQSNLLVFYMENQGIWSCALNLENNKIYIDYESMGYEVECENLYDFLIVRAACDYSPYVFPYRIQAENVRESDIDLIIQKFGKPNSEINPTGFYSRRLFWKDENEVAAVLEYDNGKNEIIVHAMNTASLLLYQDLIPAVQWKRNSI